jgi:hypothetical protein
VSCPHMSEQMIFPIERHASSKRLLSILAIRYLAMIHYGWRLLMSHDGVPGHISPCGTAIRALWALKWLGVEFDVFACSY